MSTYLFLLFVKVNTTKDRKKVVDINQSFHLFCQALTEEQRGKLLDKIVDNSDYIGWAIHVLSPRYFSHPKGANYCFYFQL